uniref:SET domain-containing protein n=2 Tax=Panagrellus redivivus TaxID=6233 RepID=A0A7E4VNX1_PANRE
MITVDHPPHAMLVRPPKREQRFVVISRGVINENNYVYIRPCLARKPVIRLQLKHPLGTIVYGMNRMINHNAPAEDRRYGLIWRAYVDNHPLGITYHDDIFGIPCDMAEVDTRLEQGGIFETTLYGKVCILPNVTDETLAFIKTRGYCYVTPCEFIHKSTQEFFGEDCYWYVVDELQRRVHGAGPCVSYPLHGFIADPYRYQFVDTTKPEDPTKFRDTHPRIYGLCTHDDERITTYLGSTDCCKTVQRKPNKIGRWYSFNVNPPVSICVSVREAKQPVLPTKILKNGLVAVRATVPAPAWSRFNGFLILTCRHPLLFRVIFPNDCAFYQQHVDVVMVYADHSLLGIGFYVVAVHNGLDMAWLDNRDEFYRNLAFASDFNEIRTRYGIEKGLIKLNAYLDDANCLPEEDAHVTLPTLTQSGEWKVQIPQWRTGSLEPWPKKEVVVPLEYYPGDPWADFEKNNGIIAGVNGPQPTFDKPILRGDGKAVVVKKELPRLDDSISSIASSSASSMVSGNSGRPRSNFRRNNDIPCNDRPFSDKPPPRKPPAPSNFVLTGPPAPIIVGIPPRKSVFEIHLENESVFQHCKPEGYLLRSTRPKPEETVIAEKPEETATAEKAEENTTATTEQTAATQVNPPQSTRRRGNGGILLIGHRPEPVMTPIPEETASMISRAPSRMSFRFDETF